VAEDLQMLGNHPSFVTGAPSVEEGLCHRFQTDLFKLTHYRSVKS
jgi:hypothetical protein